MSSLTIRHTSTNPKMDTYSVFSHWNTPASFTGTHAQCVEYIRTPQPADLAALIATKTKELNTLKAQLKAQLKAA